MLDTTKMTTWERELFRTEADVVRNHLVGGIRLRKAADLLGVADFELQEIIDANLAATPEEIATILLSLA